MKQKKQTECVEPSGYKTAKNGRLMFYCTCAECGIKKTRFVKKRGKLNSPSVRMGKGIMDYPIATAKTNSAVTGSFLPSTKHVFDRYWNGDILKSAFGTDHGILSKTFWTGPPKDYKFGWRYNP